MSMKIPVVAIPTLITAEKHFPAKTPLKWHLVSQFVIKGCAIGGDACQRLLYVTIGGDSSNPAVEFDGTHSHCKTAHALLCSHHAELIEFHKQQHSIAFSDASNSSFKPLILVPPTQTCCGKALLVR